MEVEDHLLYTKEHEWVDIEKNEGIATIGISEYAQSSLGDITFIEMPTVGDEVEQFGEFASVESVKAASDIFSPVSGEIIEVNEDLEDTPGLINKFPYKKGWIAKLKISDPEEQMNLMTAGEYRKFLESA
ncbi:Glycine cleavage system H protein [hydrothermal vent metagenome]|uniref:Glycine cleavage system H protein n=1 Tax=hydrothermal vent metagenome TaxID=652676 RepID=A0A3B1D8H3_9ZZZZ